MKKVLLVIGGIVQVLIVALHVAMFFGLARASEVPAALKPSLYIFNAAVLTAVLFFAYVSFFRRRELIETPLGRAVGWFIAIFYAQRGILGAAIHGPSVFDLVILLAIAALYAIAATPAWWRRAASGTTSAVTSAAPDAA